MAVQLVHGFLGFLHVDNPIKGGNGLVQLVTLLRQREAFLHIGVLSLHVGETCIARPAQFLAVAAIAGVGGFRYMNLVLVLIDEIAQTILEVDELGDTRLIGTQ